MMRIQSMRIVKTTATITCNTKALLASLVHKMEYCPQRLQANLILLDTSATHLLLLYPCFATVLWGLGPRQADDSKKKIRLVALDCYMWQMWLTNQLA
eukprot:463721-Karenia_brevis.AAC.1